jgi:RimJ/RimL family protein N-acetyltransferase
VLIGKRIRLRPFREDDLEMFAGWFDSPARMYGPGQSILLGLGGRIRKSMSGSLDPTPESGMLAIEHIETARVIGMIRYSMDKIIPMVLEQMEIGYALGDLDMRRQGYTYEACTLLIDYLFDAYPITRVSALTFAANEPSMRLLSKLGFQHEGTLRKAVHKGGQYNDAVLFGLLREEWTARATD